MYASSAKVETRPKTALMGWTPPDGLCVPGWVVLNTIEGGVQPINAQWVATYLQTRSQPGPAQPQPCLSRSEIGKKGLRKGTGSIGLARYAPQSAVSAASGVVGDAARSFLPEGKSQREMGNLQRERNAESPVKH
jgi:hypothetical protein